MTYTLKGEGQQFHDCITLSEKKFFLASVRL